MNTSPLPWQEQETRNRSANVVPGQGSTTLRRALSPGMLALLVIGAGLGCPGPWATAESEIQRELRIAGKTYFNVRVDHSTPEAILIHSDSGWRWIPRERLPACLAEQYPYDPRAAAQWEQEEAKRKWREELWEKANSGQQLVRTEQQTRAQLQLVERELSYLERTLSVLTAKARGKRLCSPERACLDRALDQKLKLLNLMNALEAELSRIQQVRTLQRLRSLTHVEADPGP